jgi:hypothetical protein
MTADAKSTADLAAIAGVFPGILDLASSVASSTLNEYRLDAGRYLRYCEGYDLNPLSAGSLRSWRGAMVDATHLSPNTINRKLAAIKRLIKVSAQIAALPADLAYRVSLVEPVQVRPPRHRLRPRTRARDWSPGRCASWLRPPIPRRSLGCATGPCW